MSCGIAVEEWSSSGKVEQAVVSEVALGARVQKVVKLEWILIRAILFWLFPVIGRVTTNRFEVLNEVSCDGRTVQYLGGGWNNGGGQQGRVIL